MGREEKLYRNLANTMISTSQNAMTQYNTSLRKKCNDDETKKSVKRVNKTFVLFLNILETSSGGLFHKSTAFSF